MTLNNKETFQNRTFGHSDIVQQMSDCPKIGHSDRTGHLSKRCPDVRIPWTDLGVEKEGRALASSAMVK
jgi:hypothetical protein